MSLECATDAQQLRTVNEYLLQLFFKSIVLQLNLLD